MFFLEFSEGLEIPVRGDEEFVASTAIVITDEVQSEWDRLTEMTDLQDDHIPEITEIDESRVYWKIQKPKLKQSIMDWMSKNLCEDLTKTEVVVHTPLSNEIYLYFRRKTSATTFAMMYADKLEEEYRPWTENGIRGQ